MTRKFLCLSIFFGILPMFLFSGGCSLSSACEDLARSVDKCTARWASEFGQKTPTSCDPKAPKQCQGKQICIQAPGMALASCYSTGKVYSNQKAMVGQITRQCGSIFASRQKDYVLCIQAADCDMDKFNACKEKLISQTKRDKEAGMGPFMISLLIFLVVSLLLEGFLLFGGLKLVDRSNPRNTIVRALLIGAVIALISFPLVYMTPLLGVLLSSSLFFSIIIITYQQDVYLPGFFTAFHIFFVWTFFTFVVSSDMLGGAAWLQQAEKFRRDVTASHNTIDEAAKEHRKDAKKAKESAKRAAAQKEKMAKENKEAASKKKKKGDKKKDDKKDKKDKKKSPKKKRRR